MKINKIFKDTYRTINGILKRKDLMRLLHKINSTKHQADKSGDTSMIYHFANVPHSTLNKVK